MALTIESRAQIARPGARRGRAHGPGRADVLDLIRADHARIRRLLASAESAARRGEPADARWVLGEAWDRAAALLEADCDAEEEIWYPVLSGAAGYAALIREARADHDDIREAVAEARLQEAGSPAWWRAVIAAITATQDHFAREEHGALAELTHCTSPAQRRALGQQWVAFLNARARDARSDADGRRPEPPQMRGTAAGQVPGEITEAAIARRQEVVALPEQIDVCNAGQVAQALASAISQDSTVIADMNATTFCDCAGARAIVQAHQRAAASGSALRVVAATAQVQRLFELLGIDRLLDTNHWPGGTSSR
jgi:anti-anti-sigma factor